MSTYTLAYLQTQLAITYADEEMYLVIAPGETINTEHNGKSRGAPLCLYY